MGLTDFGMQPRDGACGSALPENRKQDWAITVSKVDILIVNWNSGELLANCLKSISDHGDDAVGQVIVVDNGSIDGSDKISPAGLSLEMIRTGRNLGFGRACNLGAKSVTAPYILLLNPDAELREQTLSRSVAYMDDPAHRDVGVLGARLNDQYGNAHRHCARFPDWRTFIGNSLGLTRVARRWFKPVLLTEFDHLTERDVDHVMGAYYLIRTDLYRQLGGFDERFFVYLEDLDLSRRVHDHNRTIHYHPDVEAYHKQGGTSEQVKAHRLFYSLQSNLVYAFKHLSLGEAILVSFVTYLIEPVSRSFRALFRMSLEELGFTWRGFAMLYAGTPRTWKAVRAVLRDRRSSKKIGAAA
jgi:N-acetylglucosaminyl-diphospho-decaprenol L-rhamnosyltransferase